MSGCSSEAFECQSRDPCRTRQQPHNALGLCELGYKFNQDGKLINIATGKGFVYENEKKYDELGLAVQKYVFDLLESETSLERVMLERKDCKRSEGFFYMSEDTPSNTRGLIILISGNGAVRAGLWSRKMAINERLDVGTQIPYIRRAAQEGWAVIVMNTNQNMESGQTIEGSRNAEEHAETVWRMAVMKSPAKCIGIVAHCYGGEVVMHLLRKLGDDFQRRVSGVALTDSSCQCSYAPSQAYYRMVARNWIMSLRPLDDVIYPAKDGRCQAVSAGTNVHEETSWKSMESVFTFLKLRFMKSPSQPLGTCSREPQQELPENLKCNLC